MNNNTNDPAMEKFLADLDAVDFDDLEDDFRGVAVDAAQWEKYQAIVRTLFTARDKSCGKILKIDYLDAPDPLSKFAAAMIVMPSAFWFDGEAKGCMILAASLCDRIAVTTSGIRFGPASLCPTSGQTEGG